MRVSERGWVRFPPAHTIRAPGLSFPPAAPAAAKRKCAISGTDMRALFQVTAWLLKEAGYNIFGIHMQNWDEEEEKGMHAEVDCAGGGHLRAVVHLMLLFGGVAVAFVLAAPRHAVARVWGVLTLALVCWCAQNRSQGTAAQRRTWQMRAALATPSAWS